MDSTTIFTDPRRGPGGSASDPAPTDVWTIQGPRVGYVLPAGARAANHAGTAPMSREAAERTSVSRSGDS